MSEKSDLFSNAAMLVPTSTRARIGLKFADGYRLISREFFCTHKTTCVSYS